MRIRLPLAALALLVSATTTIAYAQPPAATQQRVPHGTLVALIDIGHIFKNLNDFKRSGERMEQQVKSYEAQLNSQRDALLKQRDRLSQYKSGSQDYKNLEASLTKKAADLKVQTELKRKDIVDQEAQLFYETHQRIVREVGAFATANGIGLVLRFERSQIDPTNRNDVLRGVNRPVIFQNHLDITDFILEKLNTPSISRAR